MISQTDSKNSLNERDHITICICTYRRPEFLERLLLKLSEQNTYGLFTYSIVVVDNDHSQSAKNVVPSLKKISSVDIEYYHEPKRNISLARNMAVKNAIGKFIAFIDDDEFPGNDWLFLLYNAYHKFNADGILGPIISHFESEPPNWIKKGKLCDRKSFKTGFIITDPKYTRTGNAFISKQVINETDNPFNPEFGIIGGGDADYFRRMIKRGFTFIWCNEAPVFETVPIERLKRSYYIKRAFTRGITTAMNESFFSFTTIKSFIAIFFYTVSLPFLFIIANPLFMKYLIKNCDHLGKLLAFCGLKVVKERPY